MTTDRSGEGTPMVTAFCVSEELGDMNSDQAFQSLLAFARSLERALSAAKAERLAVSAEELLGAIARGWCHPMNAEKVFDPNLAIAIASEVNVILKHAKTLAEGGK